MGDSPFLPPADPFGLGTRQIAALPNPLVSGAPPVKETVVSVHPKELDDLIKYFTKLNAASGVQSPNGMGLWQMNNAYTTAVKSCSVANFQLNGLLGLLKILEETAEPGWSDLPALKQVMTKVEALCSEVNTKLATDPDETVKNVSATIRDLRQKRAHEIIPIITDETFRDRLKWIVAEAAKAPPPPFEHWTDGWIDVFAISLEYAYSALLLSPYPVDASKHIEAMLEKVGSQPIDPKLVSLVLDKRYVVEVGDTGVENPLTIIGAVIGRPFGARFAHVAGMIGTITQVYTLFRFPSALSDKSIAAFLAPRLMRTLISVADAMRKSEQVNLEDDALRLAGITKSQLVAGLTKKERALVAMGVGGTLARRRKDALDLVGFVNNKDGKSLGLLQRRLAGISWGRWCKTSLSFLGLYFALESVGGPEAKWYLELKNWLGFAQASMGAMSSISKVMFTWKGLSMESGQFLGASMGGMACLISLATSTIEAYDRADRGQTGRAIISGVSAASSAAGFASFIAFEQYAWAWGPWAMLGAAVVATGAALVNTAIDASTPGAEKVFRALLGQMSKPSHPFQSVPEIAKAINELGKMKELSSAFHNIVEPSIDAMQKSPEKNYSLRLFKLGFDGNSIQAMGLLPADFMDQLKAGHDEMDALNFGPRAFSKDSWEAIVE